MTIELIYAILAIRKMCNGTSKEKHVIKILFNHGKR